MSPPSIPPACARMPHRWQRFWLLSNPVRLLILCRLAEVGESPAGALAMEGLSQSAMSQHLARLRAGTGWWKPGGTAARSTHQIADPRLLLMETLYQLYCKDH